MSVLSVSGFCIAFVCGAVWASHSILNAGTSLTTDARSLSFDKSRRHLVAAAYRPNRQLATESQNPAKAPRLAAVQQQPNPDSGAAAKAGRTARPSDIAASAAPAMNASLDGRFDKVVEQAALTPAKLASLFATKPATAKSARASRKEPVVPVPERFASQNLVSELPPVLLAYADPSSSGTASALNALSAVAPMGAGATATDESPDEMIALPDAEDTTPFSVPLPAPRPRLGQTAAPAPEVDEPEAPAAKPAQNTPRPVQKEQKLAYARPNDPVQEKSGSGFGQTFRNLFNRPKARNGVAVYDISAAKVYMPDGSVLEAHSGIGKMADNPRYTHVKMNGPTPPHTYNLKMREKRFHGVEAIRMLPVDGKNKHGRDGFLTHSYLLRGGRAESHGCVAFKDYNRFLNAFKKGKVTQLVVVPGNGGDRVRIASNGKRI
ncbi:tlde1 domain-containing protein [Neomesorhizobium albiziae]|uniref:tlde1 domain-containing protein n=1 Tax=Neomesorhizobium albiziae TaxID=335020 RepID=UPI001FCE7EC8|nr:tlde1 domain-containing protein [Mesorhizobium albiziae]GLS32403.1 hypothetical protein GCM10007937_41130 [Mesorhizobium albiziae]